MGGRRRPLRRGTPPRSWWKKEATRYGFAASLSTPRRLGTELCGERLGFSAPLRPLTLMGRRRPLRRGTPRRRWWETEATCYAFAASLFTTKPWQSSEEPAIGEGTPRLLCAASPANPNGEGGDLSAEGRFHGVAAQLMEHGGDVRCPHRLCHDTSMVIL